MHVHNGHLAAFVVEVDAVREDPRYVGIDELRQLPNRTLQLLQRALSNSRHVDVHQRQRHIDLPQSSL
jgi:hypothetical protein